MDAFDSAVGIAGLVIGVGGFVVGIAGNRFGIKQRDLAKQKGSELATFLIGLKAANLPTQVVTQINDMISRQNRS